MSVTRFTFVLALAIGAAVAPAPSRADLLFGGDRRHVSARPIFFTMNKNTLDPDALLQADYVVDHLKANPEAKITLDGHTCEPATDDYALALGDRRANSVKDYMVGKGIAPSRITTRSFGHMKTQGVGRNDKINCRVDIKFDE
ncbi:OmpA family protein [Paramagnetospirillum marisnigri]|nr:OmpA family protein [Paramagnetospirillum marisnigri]